MHVDLNLLERWQGGWSLARGLPLPRREAGGLTVEVGLPDQLRRHTFADTGEAFRRCAQRISEPNVHIKAPVGMEQLRDALPSQWEMEELRYFMHCAGPMTGGAEVPAGYVVETAPEHGAQMVRILDASGELACVGRVVLHQGTAVFDRIETAEAQRGRGLARSLMLLLDSIAARGGARERLLVATEAGKRLYLHLGWQVLAPYSTAITK